MRSIREKFAISTTAIAALVASLMPIPIGGLLDAANAANVTITINVKSSANVNLENASVALVWQAPTDPNGLGVSSIATSDANGSVSFTIDDLLIQQGLYVVVQPPSGSTDAIFFEKFKNDQQSQTTMSLTLNPAQGYFQVYNATTASGTATASLAPIKTLIAFPAFTNTGDIDPNGYQSVMVLRPEAFGIFYSPVFSSASKAGANGSLGMKLFPVSTNSTDKFVARKFGLTFSGTGANNDPYVVATVGNLSPVQINGRSTYKLFFGQASIIGQLSDNSGSVGTSSGYAEAWIFPTITNNGQNEIDPNSWPAEVVALNATGDFYIGSLKQGTYGVVIMGTGADAMPTFINNPVKVFYFNNVGQASLDGTNFSSSVSLNVTRPASNFTYQINTGNAQDDKSASLDIVKKVGNNSYAFLTTTSYTNLTNGSMWLPDGEYIVTVNPGFLASANRTKNDYKVVVSSGTATITDSSNIAASKNGSRWILNSAPITLRTQVFGNGNPLGQSQLFDMAVLSTNFNFIKSVRPDYSGIVNLSLADGDYILEPQPNGGNFAKTRFAVNIANSGQTITFNPAITPSNKGVYPLNLKNPNFNFKLVKPSDGSSLYPGSVSICTTNFSDCTSNDFKDASLGAAFVADGNYILEVSANGYSSVQYKLQVATANNVTSFVFKDMNDNVVNINKEQNTNNWLFAPKASNFDFKIVSPTDNAISLSPGRVSFCPINNFNNCTSSPVNNSGVGAANVADGDYQVEVSVDDPNYAKNQFKLLVSTVSNVTSFAFRDISNQALTVGKDGTNKWLLTPKVPNLKGTIVGTIVNSVETALTGSPWNGGKGFSLNLQSCATALNNKTNPKSSDCQQWNYTSFGTFTNTTNWAFNVTQPGFYRILIEPRGFASFTATATPSFVVAQNGSVTTNDTYPGTPTTWAIQLSSPNLSLRVVNPLLNNSLLSSGYIGIEKLVTLNGWNGERNWLGSMNIDPSNPGLASSNLATGQYKLVVSPGQGSSAPAGLANKTYRLTINTALSSTTCKVESLSEDSDSAQPIQADANSITDLDKSTCKFTIAPSSANLVGKVVDSSGAGVASNMSQQINIVLQKQRDDGNWEWLNWANTNTSGAFSLNISATGKYRLRIEPQGISGAAVTFTQVFEVTNIGTRTDLGSIQLNSPSIKIKVVEVVDGTPNTVLNTGVEIRKNGQWLDWANTGSTGIAGINLTSAGIYEFIAYPPNSGSASSLARKSFEVVATLSGTQVTAVVTGITKDGSDVYALALASPTISGVVKAPTGDGTIANAQVIPINKATGQELWQQSANSNSSGAWSLNLPQGSYEIYARAPWGNSDYGNSINVGTFTVNASGQLVVDGSTPAQPVTLRLTEATWKGIIKSPTGLAIANVSICLQVIQSATVRFTCANSDSTGKYALTAPDGFNPASSSWIGAHISIRENSSPKYAPIELNDNDVKTLLGTGGTKDITFEAANTSITITYGGSTPAPNVWVNINSPTGWLGGALTDSSGVARMKLNLASRPAAGTTITAQVDSNPNLAATYATTTKTLTDSDGTFVANTSFALSINLEQPNLKGNVTDPTANSAVAPYVWIQVSNDSTYQFITGSNTDSNGNFSLNLAKPNSGTISYTVTVNPPWNSSSNVSAKSYTLVMGTSGVTSFKVKGTDTSVQSTGGIYNLSLASPSVSGSVVSGASSVANSWVNVLDSDGRYLNSFGANTNASGKFSMALPDGNYILQANPQWGSATQLAKSANCNVTVSGGTVTTVSGCTKDGSNQLSISLRSPNLTLTVLSPTDAKVPFANVGIQIGSWFTNANADINGKVSLFVDKNALTTEQKASNVYMWIDPPFGSASYTRFSCSTSGTSTCVGSLASMPVTGNNFTDSLVDLGNFKFSAPNTTITINKPGTPVVAIGQGAYVNLFKIVNTQLIWIAGSPTNSSGVAVFNVSDADKTNNKFAIEVMPNPEKRGEYSSVRLGFTTPLTYSQIDGQSFAVGQPNLILSVQTPLGTSANKYGFVGIEKVSSDANLNFLGFMGGYGMDETGKVSITLDDGRYRLNINPGPGVTGSATTCIVDVSSGTVSLVAGKCDSQSFTSPNLVIWLPTGNVTGTITDGTNAVANAVVVAVNGETKIVTTSDATGKFGLTLDFTGGKTWTLAVLPADSTLKAATGISVTSAGALTTIVMQANV